MSGELDFLDEQTAAAGEVVTQPVVTEKPVDGATPPADQDAPPEVPEAKQEHAVPLATFLDLRDKLKKAEAKVEELTPPETDAQLPDPVKNPAEYMQYIQSVNTFNLINERMNFSERMAKKEHGAEVVEKVREWAVARMNEDEAFTDRIIGDPDPYETAIALYNEEALVKETKDLKMTPDEVKAFREWKAAQDTGAQPAPISTTPRTPQTPAPIKVAPVVPKSLVNAPSGGKGGPQASPVGDGVAFDSVFKQ